MDRDQRDILDRLYRDTEPAAIPWHFDNPPELLVELVDDGTLTPGSAVDLGCGLGSSSLYLASRGFTVTGVDCSPSAITQARARSAAAGLGISFVVADLLGPLAEIGGGFDLALDWELLHHIPFDNREVFTTNVAELLRPGGLYLSLSFSEQDPWLAEQGKRRITPLGTVLYFSMMDELRDLWRHPFEVLRLELVEVRGKQAPHLANLALLRRRT